MKNNICVRTLISLLVAHLCAAGSIRVTGRVVSLSRQPVVGATVALGQTGLQTSTDSDGAFALEGVLSALTPTQPGSSDILVVDRHRLRIEDTLFGSVLVSLYNLQGKKVWSVTGNKKRIVRIPSRLTGYFVLDVRVADREERIPITLLDGRSLARRGVSGARFTPLARHTYSGDTFQFPPYAQLAISYAQLAISYAQLAISKEGYFTGYKGFCLDTTEDIRITLIDSAYFDTLPTFRDPAKSVTERVEDLVSRMTLDEKLSQMWHKSAAIDRFGIFAYNWWSECLHGVAQAYLATVFPQAIGMAATFNDSLLHEVAKVIADEARAKHHAELLEYGQTRIMRGLTFFTPNINIFRDPRWGRGQETYGEDPYLTSRLAKAFIAGLQGDDTTYLKLVATAKHFAVHSGPEAIRHDINVNPSPRDLHDTYLPAFRSAVVEANVQSVMCAYSKINGTHACQSHTLLHDILRDSWGFEGYVVSDCGAESSLEAGCDILCWTSRWDSLYDSSEPESLVDASVKRLMTARFRLGMFDPPEIVPQAQVPIEIVACDEHRRLSLETARQSIVLLKNENNALPLSKNLDTIAVIGPNANDPEISLGNYFGSPVDIVTVYEGIRDAVGGSTVVKRAQGCSLAGSSTDGFAEAESLAVHADVAVVVLGLGSEGNDPVLEHEGTDKTTLALPGVQQDLLKKIHATGTPVILVLLTGSPLAITWADSNVAAIACAWYPGEKGGEAMAEVLFGDYNPAGRLPVTFYASDSQLPDLSDYDMTKGRTYRYLQEEPLYPFGYGLSFTTFSYSNLVTTPGAPGVDDTIEVRVDVKNEGNMAGDEVVQLYVKDEAASAVVPIRSLKGYRRVTLQPGATTTVVFRLTPYDLSMVDDSGTRKLEAGQFSITAGGGQPVSRTPGNIVEKTVYVSGGVVEFSR